MDSALARLRAGGLVAFPTETVYGLGADARRAEAVARVFAVKGRPANNPLIVHVADIEMARTCTSAWTIAAQRLADEYWPGPLSIILPRAEIIPAIVTAGGPNVALRMPDHPLTLELLKKFKGPLVGPSANRSGGVSPTAAEHVLAEFEPSQALVLDGGACKTGIESTVVDLTGEEPLVRRPGLIGIHELRKILPNVRAPDAAGDAVAESGSALPSPGLLDRHYAPKSRAVLFRGGDWAELVDAEGARGVAVLTHAARVPVPGVELVPMPSFAVPYAAALYATLRAVDAAGPRLIAIEEPPRDAAVPADADLWAAIADRLRRATVPWISA
jgi:L-threonylcarbamoyladenylate synthase